MMPSRSVRENVRAKVEIPRFHAFFLRAADRRTSTVMDGAVHRLNDGVLVDLPRNGGSKGVHLFLSIVLMWEFATTLYTGNFSKR
jgi:hypothetical protein